MKKKQKFEIFCKLNDVLSNSNTNINREIKYELNEPRSKEYCLICTAPRPHPDSDLTPNRMFIEIDSIRGFTIALALSEVNH